ncbi:carboxymuconolactone decarboxylase family protein [Nocardia farcinica]|uniref:carboxymuconolactone decarboxylase family protein n=1 Tax=Nocardia TaxID=1817 RepID=UPI000A3A432F|nr:MULTISPECIES: carboxymuconolactone decarboxylase family protein [Nocardia]MBA4858325.1 carboxymuconolactone decarboxylase family protein [Nocardia farcinica]MBC9818094.1 carboxymuconolactone decarboxylase family protein [Nocardia farcinica]MBF6067862.1 carboxymuconolactone decarboxylase family protein [Nocardia farcinica]MBF6140288.1 carboxymuconolactone decarboxylase family protein [Nocardia farcinica]MBF6184652.1 carboxymuconolactone decarboxylase family protein [Nocardia farcinica]
MRALRRIRNYARAMRQARRHRGDLVGWLARRPQLGAGTAFYESMLLFSNRLDPHLKELAELKTAGLINCEFCLDIGSALAHSSGVTEQQITDLPRYRTSPAYSELERLVIAYAEAMTATPAVDLADLREQLLAHLSKAQLAELAATIAWENQRARLNQGLGVRPTGMAEGLACALPEPAR